MLQGVAAAVMTFNLVCSGTMERHDFETDAREPYSMTLRIDLNSRQWCEAACTEVLQIFDVTPAQITLQDQDSGEDAFHMRTSHFVDRRTGAHHMLIISQGTISGRSTASWEGMCTPAPFSGIPTPRTRF